jgi:hypothetical protein
MTALISLPTPQSSHLAGLIAAVRGIQDEADPTRLMRLTVPT